VLYLTAAGATAGRGLMIDAILRAAGARNAYEGQGWNVLPMEQLVSQQAAIVALGFFQSGQTRASAWSPSRHSGWRHALASARLISLPTAAIACEGWFSLDAAEVLSGALRR
jgi:iron complex transport system substrate-binding protein